MHNEALVTGQHPIKEMLIVRGIRVVHMMEADLSYSNVMAFKGDEKIWDGNEKVLFNQNDRFVSIGKNDKDELILITYFGLKMKVDPMNGDVICKEIVK